MKSGSGNHYKEKWDASGQIKLYSRVYYSEKYVGNDTYVKLTKVTGGIKMCIRDRYLTKGDRIAAFGDFETITTPDENGNMRQSGFLIKASDVEFLTNKKREEANLQELLDAVDLENEEAPAA